jgi:hypothetical protein
MLRLKNKIRTKLRKLETKNINPINIIYINISLGINLIFNISLFRKLKD